MCTQTGSRDSATAFQIGLKAGSECIRSPTVPKTTTALAPSFTISSSGVMNSFFIPQLGSQIYAMAGMVTELNLQADRQGTFRGFSANFSGDGFADMNFDFKALPQDGYAQWIAQAKASSADLSRDRYAELVKPSVNMSPTLFRSVEPGLFESIVNGSAPQPSASITPALQASATCGGT